MLVLVNSKTEFSSKALGKGKETLVLSLFFVSCEEKYCYRVARFDCRSRTAGTATVVLNKSFFAVFSSFELGGITKHLVTGPSGNSEFCFPSTLNVPVGFASGNIEVSGRQNSLFPEEPVIKCFGYVHIWSPSTGA